MSEITIVDTQTGQVVTRPLTDDELEQRKTDAAFVDAKRKQIAELETKKAAAEAKLAALGLDAGDLKALGLA